MLKDAMIVMMLGMGTVFLVLIALLGLMKLGGKLAQRFIKPQPKVTPPTPPAGVAGSKTPASQGAHS